tara:strand:- start:475 stop:1176 length:702 start_codon:yes stop_codon:yes gene_type:complete
MELIIITGVSTGIGKKLFTKFSKNNNCIGITSKKTIKNKSVYYYPLSQNTKNNLNFDKIIKKLNIYKNKKISIYLNAAVYDQNDRSAENEKRILDINFFNQIKFVKKINNSLKPKIFKIIFFSSFEIYNDKSTMPFYKLSKKLFYEEYFKSINRKKNVYYKLLILGGIKTETYQINTKNKRRSVFTNLFVSDINEAINFIINKTKSDKNDIIFYPKIYYWINKIKNIKKKFNV